MPPTLRELEPWELAAIWRDANRDERAALAARLWRDLEARPEQLEPAGNWHTWLLLGGRGAGKTASGAHAVVDRVRSGRARRIALIERTPADARETMVEGDSGLVAASGPYFRPVYEPAKRRLTWPNGARARIFTAAHADEVRGFNSDLVWAEELAAWRAPQTWDNAMLGLRVGVDPRAIVTTTPKPTPLIRRLLADPGVHVTRMRTDSNRANLAPTFLRYVEALRGTRFGRQELDAEILLDAAGALWSRDQIERDRIARDRVPELVRIVVGVDPAVTAEPGSDETGIVAAGRSAANRGYVLEDRSGRFSPEVWAQRAVNLYRELEADEIVAEANNGGDLVLSVIRSVDPNVPVRKVHASRGKARRAQPIAALSERGLISHAGVFPELEDQLCLWEQDVSDGYSPDRMDAMVWAFARLFPSAGFGVEQALAAMAAGEARPS